MGAWNLSFPWNNPKLGNLPNEKKAQIIWAEEFVLAKQKNKEEKQRHAK